MFARDQPPTEDGRPSGPLGEDITGREAGRWVLSHIDKHSHPMERRGQKDR